MQSLKSLKESLGKRARNFSRSARRSFGVGSVSSESDSDDEVYDRRNDPHPTREDRASSPSEKQEEVMRVNRMRKGLRRLARQQQAQAAQEQASLQRQAAEFTHNYEINEMIRRINEYFGIDVDLYDPRIRFVIGQIVNAHGLTLHSLRLMGRSRILLSAVGDIAARTGRNALIASDVVYRAAHQALLAAGRLASRGASAVASRLPSLGAAAISYLPSFPSRLSSQPRAPGQPARPPDNFLQVQGPPNLGFNQVSFHAPASEHQSLPLQSQASPPPPASAPAVEEDDCSICMTPLRDNVVLTTCGHKFHSACVTPWLNSHRTCPLCRNRNPTPLVPAPAKRQRQGQGGGSRKTRSKHNSKTRRLRKSRSKPRKSYKSRKPRCSSRRK